MTTSSDSKDERAVDQALGVTPPVPVHVFLYRDHAQLREMQSTGAWAFSAGWSVHEPYDYDDCHEFVHVFEQCLPTDEESVPPEPFFVDGLATALQREDRGVPISTWVAVAALEHEWREWLSEREIDPEHERVVLSEMGIEAWPEIPDDLRAAKGLPLFDGKSLRGWTPDVDGVWTVDKGILRGRTDGNWAILRIPAPKGPVRGIRVRFRMLRGTAFQVRMNDADAGANEAIFAAWTTFFGIQGPESFLGAIAQGDWRFGPWAWQEAVLVNDDGVGRVIVNGLRVIEVANPAVVRHEGGFAIGIQAGEVEVASVAAIPGK